MHFIIKYIYIYIIEKLLFPSTWFSNVKFARRRNVPRQIIERNRSFVTTPVWPKNERIDEFLFLFVNCRAPICNDFQRDWTIARTRQRKIRRRSKKASQSQCAREERKGPVVETCNVVWDLDWSARIERRFQRGDRDWFLAVDSSRIEEAGRQRGKRSRFSKPVVVKTWPGLRGGRHFRTF